MPFDPVSQNLQCCHAAVAQALTVHGDIPLATITGGIDDQEDDAQVQMVPGNRTAVPAP
jgi:hypothetical protein